MKKLIGSILCAVCLLMSLALVACGGGNDSTKDPVAESISVSGQKTLFYIGDEFSSEGLAVTVTYSDKSDKVASADEYTVDSSAYNSAVAGNYTITVTLNETEIKTSYTVIVDERTYTVTADDGITITSGVTNGKTKAGATIALIATADDGKHIVAVKVNGTELTATEGVYSFSTDAYLQGENPSIAITLEQEAHNYTEKVVANTCHTGGYTAYTCECGENYTDNATAAKFLFADLTVWTSGVQLDYEDYTAKFTMTTDDGWSVAYRKISLKTTDYIRFAGNGTFKVEIKAEGATAGVVVISEQAMNNNAFVVPVNSVVAEDGEYTLLVYAVGARDSVHTVTECFVLANEEENVHSFGEWKEGEDRKTRTCGICGVSEYIEKIAVTFNKDNGEENTVVKVYPGEKVSALETIPVKQGYTFSKWQKDGVDFDFDSTEITEAIILKAVYTANTDTAYKIEYYEQQEDGNYSLVETKNFTGTTDGNVTVVTEGEGAYAPSNEGLYFDANHEETVLSGIVAADGSLTLKVFYSYKQVTVYDFTKLNGASAIEVTFENGTIADGDRVMLDLRNSQNETQNKLWATVTSNVASFDTAHVNLSNVYGVVAVEGKQAVVSGMVAKNNIVATANVCDALANSQVNVNNILVYGPPAQNLHTNGGLKVKGATSVEVFYKIGEETGDFDRATVNVSGVSYCGSGGQDAIFVQNAAGTTLGYLSISSIYGSIAFSKVKSQTVEFTKEQYGSGLRFINYIYCAGDWTQCQAPHSPEWFRINDITFYKDITLTATSILAVNGREASYVAPVVQKIYESAFQGELKNVNVSVTGSEDGAIVNMNLYKNGVKIATDVTATISGGIAVYDASALKVSGSVQVEVIGDVTVSGVTLDTVESVDFGKGIINGFEDYNGEMLFGVTCGSLTFAEDGKLYSKNTYINNSDLIAINYTAIKANLVSLTIESELNKADNCGGGDGVFYIVTGAANQTGVWLEGSETGLRTATNDFTAEMLAGSENVVCRMSLGCAFGTEEHLANEYLRIGMITANLRYTASVSSINK